MGYLLIRSRNLIGAIIGLQDFLCQRFLEFYIVDCLGLYTFQNETNLGGLFNVLLDRFVNWVLKFFVFSDTSCKMKKNTLEPPFAGFSFLEAFFAFADSKGAFF